MGMLRLFINGDPAASRTFIRVIKFTTFLLSDKPPIKSKVHPLRMWRLAAKQPKCFCNLLGLIVLDRSCQERTFGRISIHFACPGEEKSLPLCRPGHAVRKAADRSMYWWSVLQLKMQYASEIITIYILYCVVSTNVSLCFFIFSSSSSFSGMAIYAG